jgi:predicted XRE-type DNA-binding protein
MAIKKTNTKEVSLAEFAEDFDIDFQVLMIKSNLIDKIQEICLDRKISQRKLSRMVPGLTHDRVSKIFNGLVGHMTIDKLLQITYALKLEVNISFSDAA